MYLSIYLFLSLLYGDIGIILFVLAKTRLDSWVADYNYTKKPNLTFD